MLRHTISFQTLPESYVEWAGQELSLAQAEQTRSSQVMFQNFGSLQVFEAVFRVAEAVQFDAHAVHEREVKAARLSVLVAGLNVIQRAARLESAAESAGERYGQPEVVVRSADPQVGQEHQTGVVQHCAGAFRHGVELRRQIRELAHVPASDPLVFVVVVGMRSAVMRLSDLKEWVVHRREVA